MTTNSLHICKNCRNWDTYVEKAIPDEVGICRVSWGEAGIMEYHRADEECRWTQGGFKQNPSLYRVKDAPIVGTNTYDYLVIQDQSNNHVVTIHFDGRLEFGEGYMPDEAVRIFWESLAFQRKRENTNTKITQALDWARSIQLKAPVSPHHVTSRNVSPCFAPNNSTDLDLTDAVLFCKSTLTNLTPSIPFAYFGHIRFTKKRSPVLGTFHIPRNRSALLYTIMNIVSICTSKQVIRTNASWIITMVTSMHVVWKRTVVNSEGKSRCVHAIAPFWRKHSVPMLISMCSPNPTWSKFWLMSWRWATLVYFCPKALNRRSFSISTVKPKKAKRFPFYPSLAFVILSSYFRGVAAAALANAEGNGRMILHSESPLQIWGATPRGICRTAGAFALPIIPQKRITSELPTD